jgi:hypothetical protein
MEFWAVGGAGAPSTPLRSALDPIGAKGVASMELTVGSKTLATAYFVSEV